MKAVVQRVKWARVTVEDKVVGSCGPGMMVLVAAGKKSTLDQAEKLADRIAGLRIFSDSEGRMNLALKDLPPSKEPRILAVSQFTLYGDVWASRRPSFGGSAPYDQAKELFDGFVKCLSGKVEGVATGEFGAMMQVELCNDGPVTLLIDCN
ncbi:MAG: D-aminoacyl-tRNA deacylase [Fimbriimonadaceae bacterium]|jgi:D-tyrosyl-tRNA(Tyr) deacylase|nr:D-aminoacyl-tRNA deacylase [Fimbriimonadaceae bacterium]